MNSNEALVVIRKEISLLYDKIRELRRQEAEIVAKIHKEMSLPFLESYQKSKNIKQEKIEILRLSTRAENSLKKAGVETIENVLGHTEAGLLRIEGFGRASLKELKNILQEANLYLGQRIF